jgi:hypothetical protein
VNRAGWADFTWEGKDIEALPNESARPGWDYRYPRLELSEFGDWNSVREWARPMYVVSAVNDERLAGQIASLKAIPEGAERIVAALRFVQDDIRYTGLEIGAGAWRPTPPGEVLARRFGDCKDKVLLLVTLLRGLGIEAHPALVNTASGRGLEYRLPGPGTFDHVIAKMRWQGRDYWLDATASGQGGGLDSLVQADFGRALVLDGTTNPLETMPARDGAKPANYVLETFDLSKGHDQPARLTVRTTLRDEEADNMRVKMRSTTATQLGKGYLDYYRKRYSGIRVAAPINFTDDRAGNVFTINEAYDIDAPFEKEDDGERKFYLEAYLITEQSQPPEQAARASPLALRFPMHVRQEIVAHLPAGWNIADDNVAVSDPSFEYQSTVRFEGNKLELSYDLRNRRDHVPVAQLGEFLTKLDKTHDDAFYTFTDSEAALAAADRTKGPNVRLIVALILGLGVGVALSRMLARLRWRLPQAEDNAPRGLGGWMCLPVIGMFGSPIVLLFTIVTWVRDFGGAAQFDSLRVSVQWVMLLEFLIMCALVTLLIFGIRDMLRRQQIFPYTFILIQLLGFVMGAADNIGLWQLESAEAAPELGKFIFRGFFDALWIAYMLTSQRVRATFVNSPRGVEAPDSRTLAPGPSVVPAG